MGVGCLRDGRGWGWGVGVLGKVVDGCGGSATAILYKLHPKDRIMYTIVTPVDQAKNTSTGFSLERNAFQLAYTPKCSPRVDPVFRMGGGGVSKIK